MGIATPTAELISAVDSIIAYLFNPLDFKQALLNDIKSAAGFQGYDSQNKPIFLYGIRLDDVILDGTRVYLVSRWNYSYAEGPAGWTGYWTT